MRIGARIGPRSAGIGSRFGCFAAGPRLNWPWVAGIGDRLPGTKADKSVRGPRISGHKPSKIKHLARFLVFSPYLPLGS